MAEFDTGKDGVLSEQEFLVLADLIVRKYAQRSVEDKVILDRYRLKRTLGSGAMGTVKLATNIKVRGRQRGSLSQYWSPEWQVGRHQDYQRVRGVRF